MTALEAGCRQTPEKGTAIGLSGTVFANQQVNITDPSLPPAEEHGSLSTATVIGIAVSVIVVALIGVGLLLFYCHKRKTEENWDDYYYDSNLPRQHERRQQLPRTLKQHQASPQSIQSLPNRPNNVTEIPRTMFIRRNPKYPDEKSNNIITSGDYYDSIERGLRNTATTASSYPMKELSPPAAHSTGTLHSNYSGRSVSRGRSRNPATSHGVSPTVYQRRAEREREGSVPTSSSTSFSQTHRAPTPPASVHKRVRSNTPDSFAVQAYLDAAAETERMAEAAAAAAISPTASTATSAGSSKRRSMRSLLSLPKITTSKKDTPLSHKYILQPPISNDPVFHGDKNISRPILAKEEPRFIDSNTISGAVIVSRAPRAPTPDPHDKYAEYREVPLKSGKSDLYGM